MIYLLFRKIWCFLIVLYEVGRWLLRFGVKEWLLFDFVVVVDDDVGIYVGLKCVVFLDFVE